MSQKSQMARTLQNLYFLLRFWVSQNVSCAQYYPESAIFLCNFWCHTIFWEPFLDQKLCNLWRIERFGGSPKRVTFLSSSCAQKSCAFCEGLNVLGDKKSTILYNFGTHFDFVLKVSRFKIPQMYIYDFCMFTPILVRLRRHTLCECNLVNFRNRNHSWK